VDAAQPPRFVIDRRSVIRYADSDPDYTTRPEAEDPLAALRTLRRRRSTMAGDFEYIPKSRLLLSGG
jgi:hypothetical protein